eukprot:364772-Chlamydomonas_euryale.AAC.3
MAQHSTAQHSTTNHSTAQRSTAVCACTSETATCVQVCMPALAAMTCRMAFPPPPHLLRRLVSAPRPAICPAHPVHTSDDERWV